jgi:hypothetical protein
MKPNRNLKVYTTQTKPVAEQLERFFTPQALEMLVDAVAPGQSMIFEESLAYEHTAHTIRESVEYPVVPENASIQQTPGTKLVAELHELVDMQQGQLLVLHQALSEAEAKHAQLSHALEARSRFDESLALADDTAFQILALLSTSQGLPFRQLVLDITWTADAFESLCRMAVVGLICWRNGVLMLTSRGDEVLAEFGIS